MILSCNLCEKKFVVPDNAISSSGRLVQCSSCGNKWKQFPIKSESKPKTKEIIREIKPISNQFTKPLKKKKRRIKKTTSPTLYSPEYLSKKHGIKIDGNPISRQKQKESKNKSNANFGFYNFLIVSIVTTILLLRVLYFSQEIIVDKFPVSELYINHLFESINNIKEIIQDFIKYY